MSLKKIQLNTFVPHFDQFVSYDLKHNSKMIYDFNHLMYFYHLAFVNLILVTTKNLIRKCHITSISSFFIVVT